MPPSRSVDALRDLELGAVEDDAEPLPDLPIGGQTPAEAHPVPPTHGEAGCRGPVEGHAS